MKREFQLSVLYSYRCKTITHIFFFPRALTPFSSTTLPSLSPHLLPYITQHTEREHMLELNQQPLRSKARLLPQASHELDGVVGPLSFKMTTTTIKRKLQQKSI